MTFEVPLQELRTSGTVEAMNSLGADLHDLPMGEEGYPVRGPEGSLTSCDDAGTPSSSARLFTVVDDVGIDQSRPEVGSQRGTWECRNGARSPLASAFLRIVAPDTCRQFRARVDQLEAPRPCGNSRRPDTSPVSDPSRIFSKTDCESNRAPFWKT